MKTDILNKRVSVLESKHPDVDKQETRAFLAKLTIEELSQLENICLRTNEWKLSLTEEEAIFLDAMRRKYAD